MANDKLTINDLNRVAVTTAGVEYKLTQVREVPESGLVLAIGQKLGRNHKDHPQKVYFVYGPDGKADSVKAALRDGVDYAVVDWSDVETIKDGRSRAMSLSEIAQAISA